MSDAMAAGRDEAPGVARPDLGRLIFEAAADGILVVDAAGLVESVNPRGLALLGFAPGDLAGRPLASLMAPGELERLPMSYETLRAGNTLLRERRLRRRDGGELRVEASARMAADGRFVVVIRDLSERKAVEDELAIRSRAIEQALTAIGLTDLDGRLRFVNAALLRLWGFDRPEDVVGRNVGELTALPEQAAAVIEELRRNRHWHGELSARRRDGTIFPMSIAASLTTDGDGRPTGMVGSVLDLSERRRHEREIAAVNRLYALLSELNQAIVRATDEAGLLRDVCEIGVRQGGFLMCWIGVVEDGRVRPVARAGHDDGYLDAAFEVAASQPRGSGPTGRAAREGEVVTTSDIATDPGMAPWREAALARGFRSSAAVPLRRKGVVMGTLNLYAGEPGFFTGDELSLLREIGADVSHALDSLAAGSERLSALEALTRSEERLREALAVSSMGIFEHDHLTDRIYWSREQRAIYGVGVDDMITLAGFVSRVHPDDRARIAEAVKRAHDPAGDGRFDVEHRIVRTDGTVRSIVTRSLTTFENGSPRRTVGAVRDVTAMRLADAERDRLAARLREAEKMELVGRLAGGVAHDFNNMLSVILGNVEMARTQIAPGDALAEPLDAITDATHRSADLTRQLLAFARRQPTSPRVLTLNEAVERSLDLLRRLLTAQVELRWSPGAGPWPVRMDPAQLDQILTNLVVNARDAVGGAGRIEIATENAGLDRASPRLDPDVEPGDYVRLTVRDSGSGIDPDVLPHIFEPFFTTKAEGKGTGLGLATVFGIVKQNRGFIRVESRVGEGTTFAIHLPRTAEGPASARSGAVASRTARPLRILLVEDDSAVRNVTRRMLERLGHSVRQAASPSEALRLAGEEGAPDLAIVDIVMPEMSGIDLVARLRRGWGGLRVMYMSAYPLDMVSHQGLVAEGAHLLQKPFSAMELAEQVGLVMGA